MENPSQSTKLSPPSILSYMSSPATPSPKSSRSTATAKPPFDDPEGDVIIRSCDNVNFRTYKLLLSLASPVFKTMFTLPRSLAAPAADEIKQNWVGDVEVVPISEDSATSEKLLKFCYPGDDPLLESLNEVEIFLKVMEKYDMAAVAQRVRKHSLLSPTHLEAEPTRVFAIAYRHKLETEARIAAKYTLRHSILPPFVEELDDVPTSMYHRLLEYHRTCSQRAHALSSDFSWIARGSPWYMFSSCGCGSDYNQARSLFVTKPFMEYMEQAGTALKDRPCALAVTDMELIKPFLAKVVECTTCRKNTIFKIYTFANGPFSEEVERVTSKVVLDIRF